MRRVLFAIAFLPLMATAQVQKGIVRTTGNEKNVNGSPISGVIVKANGNTNEAISDKKGMVDIRVESKKEGYAYQLSREYKKGYELNGPMLIGWKLGYYSKTPVEITMVSRKELNRMKTEIEEKVYQQVHKKYSETIALLNDSLNKEISSAPIVERNWGEWRGYSSFWNP